MNNTFMYIQSIKFIVYQRMYLGAGINIYLNLVSITLLKSS